MPSFKLLLFGCLVTGTLSARAQVLLFAQDFAAGGTPAAYASGSPGTGQWNAISTTGANKAWTVDSGALQLSSVGSHSAYASRTADFLITATAIRVTFDLAFVSSATALTSAFQMFLGSGFSTNNAAEANADTYAKFGLNFTASDGFVVRDISGASNGAATFGTGIHAITWVLNNTGSTLAYLAPDGSTETLGNDAYDLWVGTSRQLNERTVTNGAQTMTDWKFGASGSGTYSLGLDNFVVTAIPEPATAPLLAAGFIVVLGLLARRAREKPAKRSLGRFH